MEGAVEIPVEQIIVHPGFEPEPRLKDDLALIGLQEPVVENRKFSSCLLKVTCLSLKCYVPGYDLSNLT